MLNVGETAPDGTSMKVSSEESPSLKTEEDSISCKMEDGISMGIVVIGRS
jgi:hypothetical protein